MTLRLTTASLVLTITTLMMTGGVHAITREECYEKYKAAQQAGTQKGKTWADFRKAECGSPAPTPESASTMTAPKAEKKEPTRPAAPPAAAPLGSAIIPSAVASKYSKVREGKGADLTGAWTTEASLCNKVFVKSGSRVSFAKDSELVGSGLIFQGKEIQGTGSSCRIMTTKEDGDVTRMVLACATIIMHSEQQFSVRRVNADEIFRLYPSMEGMETKYYRCPM
jgi:hypothetical protein